MNKCIVIRFPAQILFQDVFFNKTGIDFSKETKYLEAKVAADIAGKNIVKEIYVPGRLVNIVAK